MAIEIQVYEEDQELGDVSDDRPEEEIDAEDYEALKTSGLI